MRIWLQQLKISGVDLSEYGKEERLVMEDPVWIENSGVLQTTGVEPVGFCYV
jgi:hypothetical protein